MSNFAIEHGIPVMPGKRISRYPVRDLLPHQSFFIPEDQFTDSGIEGAIGTCRSQASTHGFKIATRKVEGGVRVWRTA